MTDPIGDARELLARAAEQLASAGIPDEVVAEMVTPRRVLGIARPPRMRVIDRAWRLGVLLLSRDGTLRATGTTIRAAEPAHSAFRSRLAEERLELQRAARRAGIRDGETVNVGHHAVVLGAGTDDTVILRDDALLVRWARGAPPTPFAPYLAEQLELHLRPPEGAGETER